MKLLETKEGVVNFFLYNGEEIFVDNEKIVIEGKEFPVGIDPYYGSNAKYGCEGDVLYEYIHDENDVRIFFRFDGNSFVEENFQYENKEYFNAQHFCSTDDSVDGVVKVAFVENGTEHLFEFDSEDDYCGLHYSVSNDVLVLAALFDDGLLFYTKTGERLWKYTVKEGTELSYQGKGVTVVDDIVVIPCTENGHPVSVEGYRLLTGEKLWEVKDMDYCSYAYVMGPDKMLYALQSYYCKDHRVELRLWQLNPFTGEVDMKVIKEGEYWGNVRILNTTIHGNKLFYVNQNKKVGRSLGVVDLDTKEVIEDFALEAKGYHVDAPIVSDEKVYVLIYHDGVAQNELRIYKNEY